MFSGGGQDAKAKAKTQNPRHGTIAFTSKTTPQVSCGAYIENAPRGFIPQGAWLYMDLSAVFSLAAVNGCAGQRSAARQRYLSVFPLRVSFPRTTALIAASKPL